MSRLLVSRRYNFVFQADAEIFDGATDEKIRSGKNHHQKRSQQLQGETMSALYRFLFSVLFLFLSCVVCEKVFPSVRWCNSCWSSSFLYMTGVKRLCIAFIISVVAVIHIVVVIVIIIIDAMSSSSSSSSLSSSSLSSPSLSSPSLSSPSVICSKSQGVGIHTAENNNQRLVSPKLGKNANSPTKK